MEIYSLSTEAEQNDGTSTDRTTESRDKKGSLKRKGDTGIVEKQGRHFYIFEYI